MGAKGIGCGRREEGLAIAAWGIGLRCMVKGLGSGFKGLRLF